MLWPRYLHDLVVAFFILAALVSLLWYASKS